jgi:hypothetical protein
LISPACFQYCQGGDLPFGKHSSSRVRLLLSAVLAVWTPDDQGSIAKLETVFRHFSSQVAGMETIDYWERLSSMKIYSQKKRQEMYSIIFVWKINQGLVKGYEVNLTYSY